MLLYKDPRAQQELLAGSQSEKNKLEIASEVLWQQGGVLSADDIVLLSGLFSSSASVSSKHQEEPAASTNECKLEWGMYSFMSTCSGRFWERVCSMVKAALDTFNQDKISKYSIHVICGVNELVSGPEFSTDPEVEGYNPSPFKYHHSHINFLASCEESERAGLQPTLFFAEFSNHGTDDTASWCTPVDPPCTQAEQIRCIYCEHEGKMIVHPEMKGFHGRDIEFEKLLRGEALFHGGLGYSNNDIITAKAVEVDWVHSVADDYIYSLDYAAAAAYEEEKMIHGIEIC